MSLVSEADAPGCPDCGGSGATSLGPGRTLSGRSGAWGQVTYVNSTRATLAVPCFRCGGSGAAFAEKSADNRAPGNPG